MLEKLIRKELQSAKLLKNKKSFQYRYNYLIRLVLLSEYYRGNDVSRMSVHSIVTTFLIHEGSLAENEIREIIQSRHQLKYYSKVPNLNTTKNLEFVVSKLEQKLANQNKQ